MMGFYNPALKPYYGCRMREQEFGNKWSLQERR
jgi:hypothetical protein